MKVPAVILSSPVDVGGNSISENISALLSLAVDNEKEQALHKLNLNDHTFGISVAMLQLGFTQGNYCLFPFTACGNEVCRGCK
jgi:hypothetical protein